MKNNKKGFTIIELVIVIAVIAILAAVLIPTFSGVIAKANENKAMQAARNAYSEWLTEGTNAQALGDGYNFFIHSDRYYFEVTDGQFVATALSSATGVTATVENGTLTGIVVNNNGTVGTESVAEEEEANP